MGTIIAYLFTEELQKMCRRNPVDILNEDGKQMALERFKWTKVSLLTPKELKKERLEFVQKHRDLHKNPRQLAKLMKAAGLYSDTVEVYTIVKQIAKMMGKAGGS